jgi:hypothetical protein
MSLDCAPLRFSRYLITGSVKARAGWVSVTKGARCMSAREGLIDVEKLIQPGRELSEETVLLLKKQEHDYLIARIGLQGTLWGAWACLIVIVLIVISPSFTTRNVVEGWQIVTIVIAMVSAIVFYGTFIFKRALTATGTIGKTAFSVATPDRLG